MLDDEEPIRRGLARLLRAMDFEVECFSNATDFLASLSERKPDCLILDLHMPTIDGFTVLERMDSIGVSVPVIVISGRDTPESRERARQLGVHAFLRKPVDGAVLLSTIRAVQCAP